MKAGWTRPTLIACFENIHKVCTKKDEQGKRRGEAFVLYGSAAIQCLVDVTDQVAARTTNQAAAIKVISILGDLNTIPVSLLEHVNIDGNFAFSSVSWSQLMTLLVALSNMGLGNRAHKLSTSWTGCCAEPMCTCGWPTALARLRRLCLSLMGLLTLPAPNPTGATEWRNRMCPKAR